MKAGITLFAENSLASLLSLAKILVSPGKKSGRIRNESGKEECVLLGNGPSLKPIVEKHSAFLSGKYLIAVNHFALTALYSELKPQGYVISAPEYWIEGVTPSWKEERIRFFTALQENTSWPLTLFLPSGARKVKYWQEMLVQNPNIRIHFYSNLPIEGFRRFVYFSLDRQWGIPRSHNVLGHSLSLSLFMRFKKIYLVGAEHSWLKDIWVDEDNTVYMSHTHFYSQGQAKPLPLYPHLLNSGQKRLHHILYKFMNTFQSYFTLEGYARKKGTEIINVTPGSYIDAFPRLNLDTLSETSS